MGRAQRSAGAEEPAEAARALPGTAGPAIPRPGGNRRWLMIALIFLGTVVVYVDRANLSAAAPELKEEFNLSSTELGLVLSGFFWTYAAFQLVAGWFTDRFGARTSYTAAGFLWSAFTALTAMAQGFASLLTVRLMLGAGESPGYPTNAKVVREWMPQRERGLATGIYDSGSRIGSAVALPVVTALIILVGWRGSFVATGLVGFFWIAAWWLIYRRPEQDRRLSASEMAYIRQDAIATAEAEVVPAPRTIPSHHFLRYRSVWAMMLGNFSLGFVNFWFITWFPSYLVEARDFDLASLGIAGSIPAITAAVAGWIGGLSADALIRRGWTPTRARKTLIIGGLAISSVVVLAGFIESTGAAVALLALSYGALTFASASVWLLPAELAPTSGHVGQFAGYMNFAGNAAGIMTSIVTGVLLDLSGGSFAGPIIGAGIVILIGILAFSVLLRRVEPVQLDPLPRAP